MKQPHFKKKNRNEIYVVGLAKGRDEAFELVRTIVDETYHRTGKVDVADFLKFGSRLNKK